MVAEGVEPVMMVVVRRCRSRGTQPHARAVRVTAPPRPSSSSLRPSFVVIIATFIITLAIMVRRTQTRTWRRREGQARERSPADAVGTTAGSYVQGGRHGAQRLRTGSRSAARKGKVEFAVLVKQTPRLNAHSYWWNRNWSRGAGTHYFW